MRENSIYINGFHKTESISPLWKWKGIDFQTKKPENKLYQVPEFFHETGRKIDDVVLGPGVGAGVGCGVGLGLGVVGGMGFGGSAWNQLTAVFGIGIGCGAGIGVGYGQGFGGGFSLESLRSHLALPCDAASVG
ncbi:hypothetical protein BUALT_Bualt04G0083800 [Buddleja alternifolia]|uniref:Uncharacterized protein n=1 Tax=Buddleja alternifolia TaxID=168488 RepID=A0AAV6XUR3_9LAMI|nr:hypothetical protein BUALT_Bualt04G0083800 [Buddleja alternifolia]